MKNNKMVFKHSLLLEFLFSTNHWIRTKEISEMIFKKYYINEILPNQLQAVDIIDTIKKCEYSEIFIELMNNLKIDELYVSFVHGQSHIERVALLAAYLAVKNKLTKYEFIMCIEAAKYHDIGRDNEGEDIEHGLVGAKKIKRICKGYKDKDLNIISSVIAAHSVPDERAEEMYKIFDVNKSSDIDICNKLLAIIKDADALDRFRLNNNSLSTKFIRLGESKKLLQAACELVNI